MFSCILVMGFMQNRKYNKLKMRIILSYCHPKIVFNKLVYIQYLQWPEYQFKCLILL